MSLMVDLLRDQVIQDVLVDSEVVYIMLNNGTQVTIKGVVVVEPKLSDHHLRSKRSTEPARRRSIRPCWQKPRNELTENTTT
jgi:hypothetical protein